MNYMAANVEFVVIHMENLINPIDILENMLQELLEGVISNQVK